MNDGRIKKTGNSRMIQANLPTTYSEFRSKAAAGTLPMDLLFNSAGWDQLPTFLNKANLLKDATAALFGLGAGAVPDEVLSTIAAQLDKRIQIVTGEYTGTGAVGVDNPNRLSAPFKPQFLVITSESWLRYVLIGVCGASYVGNKTESAGSDSVTYFAWEENAVSWYATGPARYQYNESDEKYHYLIAGYEVENEIH